MSELREDPLTGVFTIVAPHRQERPRDHEHPASEPRRGGLPPSHPNCPFCPGGSSDRATPVLAVPNLETGGWRTRVVENSFPALRSDAPAPAEKGALPGRGRHEVIIETPRHDLDLADLEARDFEAVIELTFARMRQLARDPEVAALIVFRNHGAGAGSSLMHAHSQLLALPFVPAEMARREAHLAAAYAQTARNPFQAALTAEHADGRRIVAERPGFLAYVPFAAEDPLELRLQTLRPSADPFELDPPEIAPFAELLRDCLIRLKTRAGDPSYNLIWWTMSRASRRAPFAGWCLRILPRLAPGGGFERASGMVILASTPECGAARLRGDVNGSERASAFSGPA